MRILVADIGGTNSRFAHFDICSWKKVDQVSSFSFLTKTEKIKSFVDLVEFFSNEHAAGFDRLDAYDVVVFAVAGPVIKNKCTPPNIGWEVDICNIPVSNRYLLNDFVAQAYGCIHPLVSSHFKKIKNGGLTGEGTIAIVGAGTGLGHCALVPVNRGPDEALNYIPVPSEGGHTAFPFAPDEISFETFILSKTGVDYCYGELIVSGRGLSLVHEFVSGECLQPDQVAQRFKAYPQTMEMFSRFYARACRNYCLATFSTGGLVISGGIAAKNPVLVDNPVFIKEFLNSPTQRKILEQIPVLLNPREDIGLLGSALYGYIMSKQRVAG